ncbi:hypothetical protein Tco_1141592, partial [Tanacetum coccineum]
DLSKLVKDVNFDTVELDSPEDDQPFIVLNDEEEEVHVEPNIKIEDTLVPVPPSPKSIKIQEQSTQLLLQSRNNKLEKEKAAVEAEVALLFAQPSFLNVQQLTKVMGNQKYVEELEVEILGDLKVLPEKLEEFQSSISVLTNKVAALENLKLELPTGLPALPGQVVKTQVKADVAKAEIKKVKEELIDLLDLDVVERMYNDKVKYDNYCNKMLNRRAQGMITNCDVLSRGKDPITLKDPIIKRNTLAKKKRKHADDLYDNFRSTKRYKSSVLFVDHQARTVLNKASMEIFFRLHKGLGINDLARTFSTFLVAEVEKRNLNPMRQMKLIEQLKH